MPNLSHSPWIVISAIYLSCYLIGSINFSIVGAALILHRDIRQSGSKNAGFTNLLRTGSKKLAVTVLLLDFARAFGVIWGCKLIPMEIYWPLVAIPLLLGNLFPVFHRFHGGKGIAMSIGIVFAVNPLAGGSALLAMLVLIFLWKKVSVGSLAFLVCATIGFFLLESTLAGILGLAMCIFGAYSHRQNIQRLLKGEEPNIFS